jgi:hypothetical protein
MMGSLFMGILLLGGSTGCSYTCGGPGPRAC